MMRSALVSVLLTVTALSSAHAGRPLGRLPRVVDSAGSFVGGLHIDFFDLGNSGGLVLRKEGNPPVLVGLELTGSTLRPTAGFLYQYGSYYQTADCSGARHDASGLCGGLWRYTFAETPESAPWPPTLFYMGEAVTIAVHSIAEWKDDAASCQSAGGTLLPDPINDPSHELCCVPQIPPLPDFLACPVHSFQLPTFTPPFRAK